MSMDLVNQLLLATQVAARAHQHQVRKDGTPYIAHPTRVAIRAASSVSGICQPGEGLDLEIQIVAMLHDVVEDTDMTLDHLRELGFSPSVVEAVDKLTRRPGETYKDFILRIKPNVVAKYVKLADIDDNIEDQSALDPEEAEFLRERYTKAREVLNA